MRFIFNWLCLHVEGTSLFLFPKVCEEEEEDGEMLIFFVL